MSDILDVNTPGLMPISAVIRSMTLRPHYQTVLRWCQSGVRGHRLPHVIIGARYYTTADAIGTFTRRITEARQR